MRAARDTQIYFIDGYTTKGRRFLGERPLGEISMLVSACREIVSATSAVLCGFLFALRTYLCERLSSSSFRPLLLFLFSPSFSSSSSSLSHTIIAVDALLLRNAPNDPLRPINLSQITVATRPTENFFRTAKASIKVYFDSCEKGNTFTPPIFALSNLSRSVWRHEICEKTTSLPYKRRLITIITFTSSIAINITK